ncbi:hypothetical protein GOP47_0023983 [Adiantum capillus-veneris]|uniref:Uncharacterized protein n=1 Tax=Adiantum capillus-veneris TaxID=13818 RepID=A0A9D4Z3W1_ADICA|nr:hypothetical protein GOP47_0023983 [Adiantum capillus-veneris]
MDGVDERGRHVVQLWKASICAAVMEILKGGGEVVQWGASGEVVQRDGVDERGETSGAAMENFHMCCSYGKLGGRWGRGDRGEKR